MDPRIDTMADVLVTYSLAAQAGEWVVIQTPSLGEPLALACSRALLRAGAHPSIVLESEAWQELVLMEGNDAQVRFASPIMALVYTEADALLRILAPSNTRALAHIDPARLALQRRGVSAPTRTYRQRTSSGEMRWAATQFPTQAAAQDAGMSLRDYQDFVYGAAFLDRPDPVAAWGDLAACQQALIDWIEPRDRVHVQAPGTDLTLSIRGRRWTNSDGRRNFPSGEIFTGPVENSAEGVVTFTFPAYLRGQQVTDVRLRFEAGRVVEASASAGEAFLQQMLDLDDGARYLGEFAFGTNLGIQRFTQNTLFDEKIGGTLHLALGQSYPETGGQNRSLLHWDMICDLRAGGTVTVDGAVFSQDGRFTV